jgi:hypothetical protein
LKTNAAYFIDLNKDWERQVNLPDTKLWLFSKEKIVSRTGFLGDLIQADNENKLAISGKEERRMIQNRSLYRRNL